MAIYPCDWAAHRYPQAQQTIYYTTVVDHTMETLKLRLCPTHFRGSQVLIQEHMAELQDDSQSSSTCEQCQKPATCVLYAKVFPAKEEMRQFAIDLCAGCTAGLVAELHVATGSSFSAT